MVTRPSPPQSPTQPRVEVGEGGLVGVGDGVSVVVGVAVVVAVGRVVDVLVAVAEAVGVGVALAVAVVENVRVAVGVCDDVRVTVAVAVRVRVGVGPGVQGVGATDSCRQPSCASHESIVQTEPSSQFSTRQNVEQPSQLCGVPGPSSHVSGNPTVPSPHVGHGMRHSNSFARVQASLTTRVGTGRTALPVITGVLPLR